MKILFLCKGNICRSPAAESCMKQLRPEWGVYSAATTENTEGQKAHPLMVEACAKLGIPLDEDTEVVNFMSLDVGSYDVVYDLPWMGLEDPYITGDFDGCAKMIQEFVAGQIKTLERDLQDAT